LRIFGLDLHISVVADLKQVYTDLGHTVDDWCLSNHSWVMGRLKNDVPMLTRWDWRDQFLQKKPWEEFFDTYKTELDQYDAFVCCYPPAFSLLYKKFDKPIIVYVPIRYEYPFQDSKEDWECFNSFLREGADQKKIILVANSMYDKKYTEAFLDREITWIPSLCKYTGVTYQPKYNAWIYYSNAGIPQINNTTIFWKSLALGRGYSWQKLGEFKGIIHFPYNCSTMSIFEQYMANIPLFFPSKKFLLELYKQGCSVLDQITWRGTFKKSGKSLVSYKGVYDPNDYESIESVSHWLQYADFYYPEALKHVNYFDSFEELLEKVSVIDCFQISSSMKEHNKEREFFVYEHWKKVLDGIA
jgi:hypothetical protein